MSKKVPLLEIKNLEFLNISKIDSGLLDTKNSKISAEDYKSGYYLNEL